MRGDRELQSLNEVKLLINSKMKDVTIEESKDKFAHYDLLVRMKDRSENLFVEVKERMGKYVELRNFIAYSRDG